MPLNSRLDRKRYVYSALPPCAWTKASSRRTAAKASKVPLKPMTSFLRRVVTATWLLSTYVTSQRASTTPCCARASQRSAAASWSRLCE